MPDANTHEHPSSAVWEEFVQRHPGHPFLQHDPLYALSESIIDAIKNAVPTFFTEDQENFERDLANTASFGFFHQRALGLTAREAQQADPETGLSLQDRGERSAKVIGDMLAQELRSDGLTQGEINEYIQQGADKRKWVDTRKGAYVGWLISNRRFHEELGRLRASWEPLIRELGRMPVYPRWPLHDDLIGREVPVEFRDDFYNFYRRWGLETMATWDWPVAMEPDLGVGMLRDLRLLAESGVVLFVPWYLLRGESLNLQGVVQRARTSCEAEHLWDWLGKQSDRAAGDLGDIRFERLGWIYRFHELVLVRRYGRACRSDVLRLDQALAGLIHRDEDTVKKLRLQLRRALHGE